MIKLRLWTFETMIIKVSIKIILIIHVKGICSQYDLSLLILTSVTWLRQCLSDFSIIKLLLYLPLFIMPFGRKFLFSWEQ